MKKILLNKVTRIITLVLLVPLVILVWLIGTQSGLRFIYSSVLPGIPGEIRIEKLEGSLIGPVTASKVTYKYEGIESYADKIIFEWKPATYFSNNLIINNLHIKNLKVKLPGAEKSKAIQPANLPMVLPTLKLSLNKVIIDNIHLEQQEQHYHIKQVQLGATLQPEQLKIKSLKIKSQVAEFEIKGSILPDKNYQHDLDIIWHANLTDTKKLTGIGKIRGNLSSLVINQQVDGAGKVTLQAHAKNLLSQLSWQAEANIVDFDPASLWKNWQGQLKGKITSKGYTKAGQLFANLDIPAIDGRLRDYPVSFNAQLNWQNNKLSIKRFEARSGKTQFNANGTLDTSMKIKWKLSSNNLAELFPHAQGQLHANGNLTGNFSTPVTSMSINGRSISVPGYKIGTVKGKVNLALFSWAKANINLTASNIQIKNHEINSLNIVTENETTEIKANTASLTATVAVKNTITRQGWSGRLEKADFTSNKYANWSLKSAAHYTYSENHFSIEPLCLHSSNGKLCLTLQDKNDQWQSTLETTNLPLAIINPWLPPDLQLEGFINTSAEIQFNEADKLKGYVRTRFSPGKVSYPFIEGEQQVLTFRGGKIDITMDKQGLSAVSKIDISEEEYINSQLMLASKNLLAMNIDEQPIQGSTVININNIALIESIVPEVSNIRGNIKINLGVSGRLIHPKLKGYAELKNGELRIPRLGLNISQISFISQTDNSDQLSFKLSARSGEGNIIVEGQSILDKKSGWPTTLSISGKNFEVSHIPVSHLITSPDLKIKIQNNLINISGKVHIPYAKLNPKDVTTAERVSDDTFIVGDEQKIEEKWLITTKIRLTLGERVYLYSFGFDGRLGGNLLLEDKPGQPTKATGEINVAEGRYTAYSQNLEVEHGRLLFSGGPVTNPGLDLRAVRRIGEITAGLKVQGNLNNPAVELFSVPAMGQTDTLAYLLLGRPIEKTTGNEGEMMAKAALALSLVGGDNIARRLGTRFGFDEMRIESSSSGEQASLVIGRYLSPKLYVGYGVGLIESFNTFNVRYQISDKWQIKGESGENQGADLLYTIER